MPVKCIWTTSVGRTFSIPNARSLNSYVYSSDYLYWTEQQLNQDGTIFSTNITAKTFGVYVSTPDGSSTHGFSISNDIQKDQYIVLSQNPQPIIGNQAVINNNPLLPINYKWQKRIVGQVPSLYNGYTKFKSYILTHSWTDISQATQMNYTPTNVNEITEYRRLLIDNPNAPIYNQVNHYSSSNVVTIYPYTQANINNTVCCDNIYYNNNIINPIIGIRPTNIDNNQLMDSQNFFYQWQIGIMSINNEIIWSNIPDAYTINYTPILPPYSRAFRTQTRYYITNTTVPKFLLGNTVTITFNYFSAKKILPVMN